MELPDGRLTCPNPKCKDGIQPPPKNRDETMTDFLHTLRAFYTKDTEHKNLWYNGYDYECWDCGQKAPEKEILTELPCEHERNTG